MKRTIAKKWASALRSGEYKQGKGALKFAWEGVTRHCCLGVLCELYQQESKKKLQTETCPPSLAINGEMPKGSLVTTFDSLSGELPEKVMRWSGVKTPEGVVKSISNSLVYINDYGTNFEDIATLVEDKAEEI